MMAKGPDEGRLAEDGGLGKGVGRAEGWRVVSGWLVAGGGRFHLKGPLDRSLDGGNPSPRDRSGSSTTRQARGAQRSGPRPSGTPGGRFGEVMGNSTDMNALR